MSEHVLKLLNDDLKIFYPSITENYLLYIYPTLPVFLAIIGLIVHTQEDKSTGIIVPDFVQHNKGEELKKYMVKRDKKELLKLGRREVKDIIREEPHIGSEQ